MNLRYARELGTEEGNLATQSQQKANKPKQDETLHEQRPTLCAGLWLLFVVTSKQLL
jgi:hypothetical protein